jgi:DNA-binding response OmpR family regulator
MSRILAIEDDRAIGDMLRRGLELEGYAVTVAPDMASGRREWVAGGHDVVLLDVMLPDGDGLALLRERRDSGDATPVVLLSAREEAELRERGVAAGANDHLAKPFPYSDLLEAVARQLDAGRDSAAPAGPTR